MGKGRGRGKRGVGAERVSGRANYLQRNIGGDKWRGKE